MKCKNISKIQKLFDVLDFRNKARLAFHLALTFLYRFTRKRLRHRTKINFFGIEYDVTVGKGELDIIYHTNVLNEYLQLEDFVPSYDALCIDVGANIGSTALSWTRTLKSGKIYAIEPHPETYKSLCRNVEINAAHQILTHQFAMGAENGVIKLFITDQGTMAMKTGTYKWFGKEISVKLITLNSFAKMLDIRSIDILKIDVEGFEVDVLLGAKEALNLTKRVVLEYHSSELRKKCMRILSYYGFDTVERRTLIFASKK